MAPLQQLLQEAHAVLLRCMNGPGTGPQLQGMKAALASVRTVVNALEEHSPQGVQATPYGTQLLHLLCLAVLEAEHNSLLAHRIEWKDLVRETSCLLGLLLNPYILKHTHTHSSCVEWHSGEDACTARQVLSGLVDHAIFPRLASLVHRSSQDEGQQIVNGQHLPVCGELVVASHLCLRSLGDMLHASQLAADVLDSQELSECVRLLLYHPHEASSMPQFIGDIGIASKWLSNLVPQDLARPVNEDHLNWVLNVQTETLQRQLHTMETWCEKDANGNTEHVVSTCLGPGLDNWALPQVLHTARTIMRAMTEFKAMMPNASALDVLHPLMPQVLSLAQVVVTRQEAVLYEESRRSSGTHSSAGQSKSSSPCCSDLHAQQHHAVGGVPLVNRSIKHKRTPSGQAQLSQADDGQPYQQTGTMQATLQLLGDVVQLCMQCMACTAPSCRRSTALNSSLLGPGQLLMLLARSMRLVPADDVDTQLQMLLHTAGVLNLLAVWQRAEDFDPDDVSELVLAGRQLLSHVMHHVSRGSGYQGIATTDYQHHHTDPALPATAATPSHRGGRVTTVHTVAADSVSSPAQGRPAVQDDIAGIAGAVALLQITPAASMPSETEGAGKPGTAAVKAGALKQACPGSLASSDKHGSPDARTSAASTSPKVSLPLNTSPPSCKPGSKATATATTQPQEATSGWQISSGKTTVAKAGSPSTPLASKVVASTAERRRATPQLARPNLYKVHKTIVQVVGAVHNLTWSSSRRTARTTHDACQHTSALASLLQWEWLPLATAILELSLSPSQLAHGNAPINDASLVATKPGGMGSPMQQNKARVSCNSATPVSTPTNTPRGESGTVQGSSVVTPRQLVAAVASAARLVDVACADKQQQQQQQQQPSQLSQQLPDLLAILNVLHVEALASTELIDGTGVLPWQLFWAGSPAGLALLATLLRHCAHGLLESLESSTVESQVQPSAGLVGMVDVIVGAAAAVVRTLSNESPLENKQLAVAAAAHSSSSLAASMQDIAFAGPSHTPSTYLGVGFTNATFGYACLSVWLGARDLKAAALACSSKGAAPGMASSSASSTSTAGNTSSGDGVSVSNGGSTWLAIASVGAKTASQSAMTLLVRAAEEIIAEEFTKGTFTDIKHLATPPSPYADAATIKKYKDGTMRIASLQKLDSARTKLCRLRSAAEARVSNPGTAPQSDAATTSPTDSVSPRPSASNSAAGQLPSSTGQHGDSALLEYTITLAKALQPFLPGACPVPTPTSPSNTPLATEPQTTHSCPGTASQDPWTLPWSVQPLAWVCWEAALHRLRREWRGCSNPFCRTADGCVLGQYLSMEPCPCCGLARFCSGACRQQACSSHLAGHHYTCANISSVFAATGWQPSPRASPSTSWGTPM